jgi:hypothetical protein
MAVGGRDDRAHTSKATSIGDGARSGSVATITVITTQKASRGTVQQRAYSITPMRCSP